MIKDYIKKIVLEEMAKRNVKKVKITVPNEAALRMVNKTPTFRQLSKYELKLGVNFEYVNHYQFSRMENSYPMIGISVEEVFD